MLPEASGEDPKGGSQTTRPRHVLGYEDGFQGSFRGSTRAPQGLYEGSMGFSRVSGSGFSRLASKPGVSVLQRVAQAAVSTPSTSIEQFSNPEGPNQNLLTLRRHKGTCRF